MTAQREHGEHGGGPRDGPDDGATPEGDHGGSEREDQRPAEIGEVLRRLTSVERGVRGAGRGMEEQIAGRSDEIGEVVLVEVAQERRAALGQRAEELDKERAPGDDQRGQRGYPEAEARAGGVPGR